ncbi:caspase Dronc [Hetaerina americana]|uniref:caspase Dronc n=1 Tax=Hetaerina americana TaxID=62018 RepID=UPI003A7F5DC3
MDTEHRNIITANLKTLVDRTDLNTLIPKLIEKGVFTAIMVEPYQKRCCISSRRELFLDIQTRGPKAFQNLVSALNDTGYRDLAVLLDPESEMVSHPPNQNTTHPYILPQYITQESPNAVQSIRDVASQHPNVKVNLSTRPQPVVVRKAETPTRSSPQHKTMIYRMLSRPKGYALIINIKKYINDIKGERNGAEVDEENLHKLFEGLGYDVTIHADLCGLDMKNILENFSTDKKHKDVDSCVLVISCHGERIDGETHFIASDGKPLSMTYVLNLFTNEKCIHLRNKPKIFLFQACRGFEKNYIQRNRTALDGQPYCVPLRKYSDMLIANATVDGHESHRDCFHGTWYIQAVCEVFMDHAWDTEIMEMLKKVDEKLEKLISESGTMQTTSFENRGFKTFYFNPGVYNDGRKD